MNKLVQFIEEFVEKGEVSPKTLEEVVKEVEEEMESTVAQDLIARVEELISEIEGVECSECEKLRNDLEDALAFLKSGDYNEEDLGEVEEWLDEVEEVIGKAKKQEG